MSDQAGPVSRLGQSLISALPPAFIVLVLLNLAFLAVIFWFLDDQLTQRDAMARELFHRCLEVALKQTP